MALSRPLRRCRHAARDLVAFGAARHTDTRRNILMTTVGIRGTFFDFVDDPWKHVGNEQAAARFHQAGLMVVTDGVIEAFGPYETIAAAHPGVQITHIKDRIIVPGFIDRHL